MRRDDDVGPAEDRGDERRPLPKPPGGGIKPRHVLIAISAIVLIAFAVANFKMVEVNFLAFTTQARLVTVIVVAAALGFVIGWFVGRPTREERRILRRRDRRDD